MHGIDAFEANLDEKLDLAEHAVDRLAEIDPVEVVAEPQLSMLAFRAHPEGLDGEELDAFNEAWMQRVNERGRVHLSGTTLADRFTLRISILSFAPTGSTSTTASRISEPSSRNSTVIDSCSNLSSGRQTWSSWLWRKRVECDSVSDDDLGPADHEAWRVPSPRVSVGLRTVLFGLLFGLGTALLIQQLGWFVFSTTNLALWMAAGVALRSSGYALGVGALEQDRAEQETEEQP